MNRITELLFEGAFLKHVPRSGFNFLGSGNESVAEHVYSTTFIAFVMAQLVPAADALKMLSMCLVHDLPETRLGDLNYVQKRYVAPDEGLAIGDALKDLAFAGRIKGLLDEFNTADSLEARLARDADQLALILDLKSMMDMGYRPPHDWIPHVVKRLKTDIGRDLADQIQNCQWDAWWRKIFVDSNNVHP